MSDRLDIDNIIKQLKEGKLDISSQLDSFLGNSNLATLIRRLFLEKELNLNLSSIASTILDFEEITGRNVENAIGAVQIPLAIVGPLFIKGTYAYGKFYIPLATTRRDLIDETHKGCKALTLGGGVNVKVLIHEVLGTLLLIISRNDSVVKFIDKLNNTAELIKNEVNKLVGKEKLKKIKVYNIGNLILLKTIYDLKGSRRKSIEELDEKVCKIIKTRFNDVKCLTLSKGCYSNLAVDKNLKNGYVIAEAIVKKDVIKDVLGVSPEDIHNLVLLRNLIKGSTLKNIGLDVDFNDAIISVYTAIGLDVSSALKYYPRHLWTDLTREGSLRIGITLPVLDESVTYSIAPLPPQIEASNILGILTKDEDQIKIDIMKLTEILASIVLARALGQLSALAPLVR